MKLFAVLAFIAARGFTRSRLTTALLVLAVAAGVGMQIPNTANLIGYSQAMFEEATTRGFGDVRVESLSAPVFDDADALSETLARVDGVRAAVPILTFPAGLDAHGRQIACELHGIDPKSRFKPYRVSAGADLTEGAANDEVLVGTGLAAKLDLKPGDRVEVRIILPAPSADAPPIVAELSLTVRGTARGTFGAYASLFLTRERLTQMIARPHAATRVLLYAGSGEGASGLSKIRRDGPRATQNIARAAAALTPRMRSVTWMEENPLAESALRGNEALGIVSHTMVVIAVTIPVGALLYVTVEGRRREIAMLAALGFARLEIFVAFVLQALGIGLTGSVLGCVFGAIGLAWFERYPIFESAEFDVRPVASASTFYEPALVILIATIVAALYPAWHATRVDPAKVLRT